jgi:RND family efflux transporter MFP subunit
MLKAINRISIIVSILLLSSPCLYAQENEMKDMPPAKVVVSEVSSGMIAPETEFIGTVYYQEVSDIASEVNGLVEAVEFEEGRRVKKGDVLVRLSSELLEKTIQATIASHEQVLSDLEKAKIDLQRAESLFKEELISEQSYDEHRFRVKGLEKRSASLKAEVERLGVELKKKIISTPFEGVVVKKHVDRGEWLSQGSTVATIAKGDVVDVVVEVPEGIIKHITQGSDVRIKAAGKGINGKVFAIIPRGDISTRTIPVKVRVKNTLSLIEGMEAKVTLPAGEKKKTLTVPRDAVVTVFGSTAVFAVIDSEAKMIPVDVVGYKGITAGIYADGLSEGMKVVVKGNERLKDGQPVLITDK